MRLAPLSTLSASALLALLSMACDTTTSEPPPEPDGPARGVVSGSAQEGEVLTVQVVSAVPDPPARSDVNIWRFAVLDSAGAPVEGCAVEVEPTMPAHGHGTTPTPEVAPIEGEAGHYEARPLNLFMPGEWHIAVRPTCGSMSDEVVFVVDIQS